MRNLATAIAAGVALTNSTTEAVLSSFTLPANHFQPGKSYRVRGSIRATSTNSTDTLRVRARIGPTTLTGTVVADASAVDVANNDIVVYDLTATVRSVTPAAGDVAASCVLVVHGYMSVEGAEGTATPRVAFESVTTLVPTAAQLLELTGVWSVASASNSAQAETFLVDEVV